MSLVTSRWFGQPLSKRITVRRSTAIAVGAFVGLGSLYLQVREPTDEKPAEQVFVIPVDQTSSTTMTTTTVTTTTVRTTATVPAAPTTTGEPAADDSPTVDGAPQPTES